MTNERKREEIAAWNLQVEARKAAKQAKANGRPVRPHRSGGGYPATARVAIADVAVGKDDRHD